MSGVPAKHRNRRKSEAQRGVEKTVKLSEETGRYVMQSGLDGNYGLIHTNSKFLDPRFRVAEAIRGATDPIQAPRTHRVWVRQDSPKPQIVRAASKPGEGTRKAIIRINEQLERKASLRRAHDRVRCTHLSQGITQDLIDEQPKKSRHERIEAAAEFLRNWLSDGPRPRKDIMKDAARDLLLATHVAAAKKMLGVWGDINGLWHMEPKPQSRKSSCRK